MMFAASITSRGSSNTILSVFLQNSKRFATKKSAAAKARQKRGPEGKRLGLKKYPGEYVETGNVIVKQHGTKNHPGRNVALGRDFSIYALMPGYVHFSRDPVRNRNVISVVEWNPNEVDKKNSDTFDLEFRSKVSEGWRNDSVYARGADGKRHFDLVDLSKLPPVDKTDLSAVEFDAMAAHLKAVKLNDVLNSEQYQYPQRIKDAVADAEKSMKDRSIFNVYETPKNLE